MNNTCVICGELIPEGGQVCKACGRATRNDVRVTAHAQKMMRKRLKIPKYDVWKVADAALLYGIRHSDTKGGLHRYVSALYFRHRTANNVRIYQGNVFIFHNSTLITVFPLPPRYYGESISSAIRKHTLKGVCKRNDKSYDL